MMHTMIIEKADNGYVLRQRVEDLEDEKMVVAKDMDEMMGMMKEIMGEKHDKKMKKGENYREVEKKANKLAMKK